ncbi:hypothetical protein [Nocardia sp. NBC_00403]
MLTAADAVEIDIVSAVTDPSAVEAAVEAGLTTLDTSAGPAVARARPRIR